MQVVPCTCLHTACGQHSCCCVMVQQRGGLLLPRRGFTPARCAEGVCHSPCPVWALHLLANFTQYSPCQLLPVLSVVGAAVLLVPCHAAVHTCASSVICQSFRQQWNRPFHFGNRQFDRTAPLSQADHWSNPALERECQRESFHCRIAFVA